MASIILPLVLQLVGGDGGGAGGAGGGGGLQETFSRESHQVFRAVMASLRLYCID